MDQGGHATQDPSAPTPTGAAETTRRSALLGVVGAAAAAQAAWAQPARPSGAADAAAYGRLPAVFAAAISPDGTKIALGTNSDERGGVRILDLVSSAFTAGFDAANKQTLRSVDWADDGLALATVTQTFTTAQIESFGWRFRGSARLLEYSRFAAIDVAANRAVLLLDKTEDSEAMVSFGALVTPIAGDPGYGRIIASVSPLPNSDIGVFRVDLRSSRGRTVRRFPSSTVDVLLTETGEPIARSAIVDAKQNTWDVRAIDGKSERVLIAAASEFGQPPDLAGRTKDGRIVLRRSGGPNETWRLIAIDRASGAENVLLSDDRFDVSDVIIDRWTHVLVGASWIDDLEIRQTFFDPDLQRVYDSLREAAADGMATIESWSRDRSTFVVHSEQTGYAGGAYFLYRPAQQKFTLIARRYPGLREQATVQSITYRARDGAKVPAILTTPDQPLRTPSPLVVLIHGGPGARDAGHFNWWPQFLAARGYTVLQPNFRGSTGYGHTWRSAGYGEWGGLMSRDVEDGVRALMRSGRIDAQRIAFIGASYGAYAALTAGMQTPELARCVAGVGGVYDLPKLLGRDMSGVESKSSLADFLTTTIGALKTDRVALEAVSPTRNAARITAPVLLMHGTEDSVVDISQTRDLKAALTAAGKPPTYVELKGDDHWMSDGGTRTRMLEELDRFLAQHLA